MTGTEPDTVRLQVRPDPTTGSSVTALVCRGLAELLVTVGLLLLLFVVYELWVTDLVTAREQARITGDLDRSWSVDPDSDPPADGQAYAKIYLPTIGQSNTVVEGITQDALAVGPGHYPASAAPGQPGNTAIAGHRVSHGAPFYRLDELRSCDPVVLETRGEWLVYRVLPFDTEVAGWAVGRGRDAACAGVGSLRGQYAQVTGRQIVPPSRGDVVAPVPRSPRAQPDPDTALLTLTTCNPRYSARERLIVHAMLTTRYPKDRTRPTARPPELAGL